MASPGTLAVFGAKFSHLANQSPKAESHSSGQFRSSGYRDGHSLSNAMSSFSRNDGSEEHDIRVPRDRPTNTERDPACGQCQKQKRWVDTLRSL